MTALTRPGGRRALSAAGIAFAAGVIGAIQPEINTRLADRVGSALLASLVNFGAAFLAVLVALAARPRTRELLRLLPAWPVPWWTLTAGLGGAVVVLAGALAVETTGVAIFSVAFFAGQITAGLVVDRIGLASGGRQPLVATRVQGAALALVAVIVSQLGRPVGEFAPALVAFVVVAGGASAFQAAFNARIARAVGDAVAPTAVNVTVGLSALVVCVAVVATAGGFGDLHWPSQPWLYAGGFLGVTIVWSLALASAAIGVLRTTVAMLAAQLITAFVIDWVLDGEPPTIGVVVGAFLILVAVAMVRRER